MLPIPNLPIPDSLHSAKIKAKANHGVHYDTLENYLQGE